MKLSKYLIFFNSENLETPALGFICLFCDFNRRPRFISDVLHVLNFRNFEFSNFYHKIVSMLNSTTLEANFI